MTPEEFKNLKIGDMVIHNESGDIYTVRSNDDEGGGRACITGNPMMITRDPSEWGFASRSSPKQKTNLSLDDVINPAVLAAIPRQPQVQCSVDAQLTVLYLVANRLGLYDAADVVMAHKQAIIHRNRASSGDAK